MLGTIVDRRLSTVFEQIARRHLRNQVPDPELRGKLTPTTRSAASGSRCRTPTTRRSRSRTPRSSPSRSPRSPSAASAPPTAPSTSSTRSSGRPASASSTTPASRRVRGRDGRTLHEAWQGSPRAYLGTAVAGFPEPLPPRRPEQRRRLQLDHLHQRGAHQLRRRLRARDGARRGGHGRGPPARSTTPSPARPSAASAPASGTAAAARAGTSTRTGATGSGGPASRPTSGAAPAASTAAATSPSPRSPRTGTCPARAPRIPGVSTAVAIALAGVLLGMSSPAPGRPSTRGSRVDWRQSTALGTPAAGSLEHGVRFPAAGHHFFTWDPILHRQPDSDWRRWGTDDLVRTTLRVLREFARRHPHAPRIGVGDLSLRHGGYFGPEVGGGIGHATHQNGLDVDVYYPRTDRASGRRSPSTRSTCGSPRRWSTCSWTPARMTIYVGPNLPLSGPAGRRHAPGQPRQPPPRPDRPVRE